MYTLSMYGRKRRERGGGIKYTKPRPERIRYVALISLTPLLDPKNPIFLLSDPDPPVKYTFIDQGALYGLIKIGRYDIHYTGTG